MSKVLGYADLKQMALPTGIDLATLDKITNTAKLNFAEVYNMIAVALSDANAAMVGDPILGGLFYADTEPTVTMRNGSSTPGMEKRTEYGRPDPKRGEVVGHHIPIATFDESTGFTYDSLRAAREDQIMASIDILADDMIDNFEKQLLTRFFSSAANAIGTTGYDMPFADGVTTYVSFTPPPYKGHTFASSHVHFTRAATDQHAAQLEAGAKHLWEHGRRGPYMAMVSFADVATWTAITGFIKPNRGVEYVNVGSGAPYAVASMQDERMIGMYETSVGLVTIWASPRIPTGYMGLYRSYGTDNVRNPLQVRYAPDHGLGGLLMPSNTFQRYPLEEAYLLHEFGVGVRDRLGGYCVYFAAAGSYTDPTIT